MKATLVALVGFLAASASHAYDGALSTTGAVSWDGLERTYCTYVPRDLPDAAVPLVAVFHGGLADCSSILGVDASKRRPFRQWLEVADREKFIVVAPNGVDQMWNDCRADCTSCGREDDVGFVRALLDEMSEDYPIDPRRVYATGESNGGHMSYRLAQEASDRFAAVAAVVANMAADNKCAAPSRPISVAIMNGTEDAHAPWEGGVMGAAHRGTVLSATESAAFWQAHNLCPAEPALFSFPDLDTADGDGDPVSSTVERASHAGCADGTEVRHYVVTGGGHVMPSVAEQIVAAGEDVLGQQNHDLEGAEEIWSFFTEKSLLMPSDGGDTDDPPPSDPSPDNPPQEGCSATAPAPWLAVLAVLRALFRRRHRVKGSC